MEKNMEKLAMELYKWCQKNGLWMDTTMYFNGKALSYSREWGGVKGKEIAENLYEYEDKNPRDYFPGGDCVFACSFEGPLNHVLNGYVRGWAKLENEFHRIFDKYGLIFEMYNSWNGNAYQI